MLFRRSKILPSTLSAPENTFTSNLPPSYISSPKIIRPGLGILILWGAGVVDLMVVLLTSLLMLLSLTWCPYCPPAVLKRHERCASYN